MSVMIIDINQIMISNLMVELTRSKMKNGHDVEEDLLRHMIVNQLRGLRKKFKGEYDEVVIACDDRKYWRKQVFPYYKANRAKTRSESLLDWPKLFVHLNKILQEMKDNFPWTVIQIELAEADDVIGGLVMNTGLGEELMLGDVLIVSGDKDFMQLQRYGDFVKQWDPTRRKWLRTDNANEFLFEHIVRGDKGDGVPNIKSADDTFVTDKRQTPIASKKVRTWVTQTPGQFCDSKMLRNWKRNEQLIDLSYAPKEIHRQVIDAYNNPPKRDRGDLLEYFMTYNLTNLIDQIGDF